MMEREISREVDLHQVRRIAEVRASAANELLEAGWVLHDIYFTSDGDYHSKYILLCLDEITCPQCGGCVKVEVMESGERIRYVCSKECDLGILVPVPVSV